MLGLNQPLPLTLYRVFGLTGAALAVRARRYLHLSRGVRWVASALVIVLLLPLRLGAFTQR